MSGAVKLVARKPPPRPLAERGRMMYVPDVHELLKGKRSAWWVRTQFAQDKKQYLGRTPYWWEADVLAALDAMGVRRDS
jgi:hypothetical protein